MDDETRPGSHVGDGPVGLDLTDYCRRILIERDAIRSALYNPGGSIILGFSAKTEDSYQAHSSVIGNDLHLDLMRVEEVLFTLPKDQQQALLSWADGLTSQQAGEFLQTKPGALRMRRQRALQEVVRKMSSGGVTEAAHAGGAGRRPSSGGREEQGQDAQEIGPDGPGSPPSDQGVRDTDEFSAPESVNGSLTRRTNA